MNKPKLSVIIAVYNNPDVLRMVFYSLLNQIERDFEIIISDDGSGSEVADVISEFKKDFEYPILHVWHEDKGFRKTVIANKSAMSANGEYLVFIDGDMILHRYFLRRHKIRAKKGHIQAGRRVMLNSQISENLNEKDILSGRIEEYAYWKNFLDSRSGHVKYGLYIPFLYVFLQFFHRRYCIKGCNFSVYKSDFLKINGYDERIIGRGLEDDNLSRRFQLAGIRINYISQEAIAFHVYHKFDAIPHSKEIIEKYGMPKKAWTEHGIEK